MVAILVDMVPYCCTFWQMRLLVNVLLYLNIGARKFTVIYIIWAHLQVSIISDNVHVCSKKCNNTVLVCLYRSQNLGAWVRWTQLCPDFLSIFKRIPECHYTVAPNMANWYGYSQAASHIEYIHVLHLFGVAFRHVLFGRGACAHMLLVATETQLMAWNLLTMAGNHRVLPPTECTSIVIQLCLRSQIGLWGKYYYTPFDIMHCFCSDVGFTNIVVWSTGQSGAETKYTMPTVPGQLRCFVLRGIFSDTVKPVLIDRSRDRKMSSLKTDGLLKQVNYSEKYAFWGSERAVF